ncbi:hypothetical protein RND71_009940 [Anisodus tanguticus]|uniref:Uncharacterized protein n=1 Tax=Anisodus tanguticus TaxID=243964 RepID=A0AAE1VSA6_9SOLA|nr:hypothetical protein RND71_009940 [Anisodus tanguticus]
MESICWIFKRLQTHNQSDDEIPAHVQTLKSTVTPSNPTSHPNNPLITPNFGHLHHENLYQSRTKPISLFHKLKQPPNTRAKPQCLVNIQLTINTTIETGQPPDTGKPTTTPNIYLKQQMSKFIPPPKHTTSKPSSSQSKGSAGGASSTDDAAATSRGNKCGTSGGARGYRGPRGGDRRENAAVGSGSLRGSTRAIVSYREGMERVTGSKHTRANSPKHYTDQFTFANLHEREERQFLISIPSETLRVAFNIRLYPATLLHRYAVLILPTLTEYDVPMKNGLSHPLLRHLEMSLAPRESFTIYAKFPMRVLLWNCRGCNNPDFIRNFQAIVTWNDPNIIYLTETKISNHSTLLDALDFTDWFDIGAN